MANFIRKEKGQEKGVVISYDSRNFSKEFSDVAALCLNANGIKFQPFFIFFFIFHFLLLVKVFYPFF